MPLTRVLLSCHGSQRALTDFSCFQMLCGSGASSLSLHSPFHQDKKKAWQHMLFPLLVLTTVCSAWPRAPETWSIVVSCSVLSKYHECHSQKMFLLHIQVRKKMKLLKKACKNEARISRKKKTVLFVRHVNVPLENLLLPECPHGAREVTSTF